jgi:hypothetical protein
LISSACVTSGRMNNTRENRANFFKDVFIGFFKEDNTWCQRRMNICLEHRNLIFLG